MNLDDFIVPSSVASPAGLVTPAPIDSVDGRRNAPLSGVPVPTTTKRSKQYTTATPASSVPGNMANRSRGGDFDYVQRRVRKTSVDERTVRQPNSEGIWAPRC